MAFRAPQPIEAGHRLTEFDSGVAALDDWLQRRALANQASGASRTFVICEGQVAAPLPALPPVRWT